LGGVVVLLAGAALPAEDRSDVGRLVARIRGVGAEGAGNAAAAAAWRDLARLGADALPEVLVGLDGADPVAANWLRAVVDAIAERETGAGRELPADKLEAFVKDTRHSPVGRRLAYEWLARVDKTAPGRLLPGLLDDPSTELRRDAVAVVLDEAQARLGKGDKEGARAAFRKALAPARDPDQVEVIAKALAGLGEPVDLAAHFGLIRSWHVVGPFDNAGGKGFDTAFGPESKTDVAAPFAGKGGQEVCWAEHTTADPRGNVDLNKVVGKCRGAVAYARAVVDLPAARDVELRAATENALKMFVNGKAVFAREEYHHGKSFDQHVARISLRRGRNTILLKVCQNEQTDAWARAWDFQLRVCDAVGGAVPLTVVGEEAKP
jgi:hypothetical protein